MTGNINIKGSIMTRVYLKCRFLGRKRNTIIGQTMTIDSVKGGLRVTKARTHSRQITVYKFNSIAVVCVYAVEISDSKQFCGKLQTIITIIRIYDGG